MKLVPLALAGALALGGAAVVQAQTASKSHYIVQLAAAPAAGYRGGIAGYAATRPAPGQRFDVNAASVQAYIRYLDTQRNATLALVPSAAVTYRYNVAFNGFAARLSAAEVAKLRGDPRVLAVTLDTPRRPDTSRTPAFLGLSQAGGLWSMTDAAGRKVQGEDVIVGIIDSGIWPEDPSFSDKVDAVTGEPVSASRPGTVVYGPPPSKWKGECQAGEGFTAAHCNRKLIGARFYREGFDNADLKVTPGEYSSPRDGDGHGSHTASTAAGNGNVAAEVNGKPAGRISGMAPRARVAAYKVCWEYVGGDQGTCLPSDSVAAIDQAVADGVDVLNYSISGTRTNLLDGVEVAFLFAADAGVFVAASAGNDGPTNTVAHPTPWLTTVAASTHDRYTQATATLGNGARYTGASQSTGTPSSPLVLSTAVAAKAPFDDSNTDARLCFLGALDPAKVAGKIVVCDRGSNARVEKSQAVKEAGGLGMLLLNTSSAANDLIDDAHFVPTVHLPAEQRTAVRAYAATGGATAAIGVASQAPNVVAPVMADFSSRGPNLASAGILKPDISAPGVNVLAAVDYPANPAEHAAIVAGTLVPPAATDYISGTSMSSPHVAGIGALMKQLRPAWSPAAIKSALMTSTTAIKRADGSVDPDRWGYGAGHVAPNGAARTTLVYDAGFGDYLAFLCGAGALASNSSTCAAVGQLPASQLNLASLTGDVVGRLTFQRTVTNLGDASATFSAAASLPGYSVRVTPSTLTLAPGASANFEVALARGGAPLGQWAFGSLSWTGGSQVVRSPLTVRALEIAAPAEVTDLRAVGTKVMSIGTGYDGTSGGSTAGLVPAQRVSSRIATGDLQCFGVDVPAGALHARFALYNADTSGGERSDLDLYVYRGDTLVGLSGTGSADEVVDLSNPVPGRYDACVDGYAPLGGSAAYGLSTFVVRPGSGNLRAAFPSRVYLGGTASVGLAWSAPAAQRHLGVLVFRNAGGSETARTLVSIDNASGVVPAPQSGGRKTLAAAPR